ncbi:hypothetical protein [Intestinibacillus massiliensis]
MDERHPPALSGFDDPPRVFPANLLALHIPLRGLRGWELPGIPGQKYGHPIIIQIFDHSIDI